ncbi:S-layer homology domain-containing protein [Paenibacillus sp. FJAT-26967]|uniref:S-layer homology domain-containing protein n=1 Tax=Paenibacillus sp. FJAT-26967 TaxID=1729690 RepID=UPI0008392228|nr:S-layer homology domain-containing protein [Paenibacillus sp. FJAT-26967]
MKKFTHRLTITLVLLAAFSGLYAGPARAGLTETPFPDVDSAQYGWAVQSIKLMAQKGILQGYPDGTFKPGRYVTKAEWAVMTYRLFDKYRPSLRPELKGYNFIDAYADVPASHWAYREISDSFVSIADNTVTRSGNQDLYNPEYTFSRFNLASMLHGYYGIEEWTETRSDVCTQLGQLKDIETRTFTADSDLESFRNNEKTDRYESGIPGGVFPILLLKEPGGTCSSSHDDYSALNADALLNVHTSGILTAEDTSGKFYPSAKLTRAEAVTVLHRLLDHLKTEGVLHEYSSITPSDILRPVPMPAPKPGEAAEGTGPYSRDLQREGEFNTIVYPGGKKYMKLELTSKDAVDLYLYMNGDIAFLRQEELPRYIQVDRVAQIGIKSQSRNPEKRSPLSTYPASLHVSFHDEIPPTTKPGKGTGSGSETNNLIAPPGASAIRDLKREGELKQTFPNNGSKYVTIQLISQDKVDLYVQLSSGTAFLRQEELPVKLKMDGNSSVTIRTQSRNPEKRTSQQSYNAHLYVTFTNQ